MRLCVSRIPDVHSILQLVKMDQRNRERRSVCVQRDRERDMDHRSNDINLKVFILDIKRDMDYGSWIMCNNTKTKILVTLEAM